MNPFYIETNKKNTDFTEQSQSSIELLKKHNYDPTVKDRLLETALRGQQQEQVVEPTLPPDDTPANLHRDIMIVPEFLSADICDEYVEFIKKQQEHDLSVFDAETTNQTGEVSWEIDKKTRDTQTVDIAPIQAVVTDLMHHAVSEYLNPFYNIQIKDSEQPQILVYHPGGHYQPHIDGETLFNDGSGQLKWKRNVERDISMVIYFNSDFDGGELVFPKQAITVKPRTGLMVAFPSNHHFLHGVNPVIQGTRYTIVNWFTFRDMKG